LANGKKGRGTQASWSSPDDANLAAGRLSMIMQNFSDGGLILSGEISDGGLL
jgi:hypothetical protein